MVVFLSSFMIACLSLGLGNLSHDNFVMFLLWLRLWPVFRAKTRSYLRRKCLILNPGDEHPALAVVRNTNASVGIAFQRFF
jgi:hypothetical protein